MHVRSALRLNEKVHRHTTHLYHDPGLQSRVPTSHYNLQSRNGSSSCNQQPPIHLPCAIAMIHTKNYESTGLEGPYLADSLLPLPVGRDLSKCTLPILTL